MYSILLQKTIKFTLIYDENLNKSMAFPNKQRLNQANRDWGQLESKSVQPANFPAKNNVPT